MNLNKIRKDYSNLTMLERLSLADNAVARDDENELRAIVDASPKKHYSQVDYLDLLNEINKMRFCNLIVRLSYIMQFDYFFALATLESLRDETDSKRFDKLMIDAQMTAYMYVRATDTWKSVCDEFDLRPDFEKEVAEHLFSVEMMEQKEKKIRRIALSEDEVKKQMKRITGKDNIKTFAEEVISIKQALDLPINNK